MAIDAQAMFDMIDDTRKTKLTQLYTECTKKELFRRIAFSAYLLSTESIMAFTHAVEPNTIPPTTNPYNDDFCMEIAYQSWLIDIPSSLEINLLDDGTVCGTLLKNVDFKVVDMKPFIYPCLRERLFLDALRIGTGIEWKTNHNRVPENTFSLSTFYSHDLKKPVNIILQYESDKIYDNIENPEYISRWDSRGLNISHYANIKSKDDSCMFSNTYTIDSYMEWNNYTSESELTQLLIAYMK